MKIGIDARLYGSISKGLGRYVSELIAALEELDRENDYVIFLRDENFGEYTPKNPRFTKVRANIPWYGWREQLQLPKILNEHKLDLVHFPHFNVPLLYRRPFVVTIHDLILLRHPTTRATTLGPIIYAIKFLAYRLAIGRAVADAKEIFVPTEWVRHDIIESFPVTKRRTVTITREACSHSLRNEMQHPSPIPAPYALYVGNAYPHKNLERLLEAFALFRKKNPSYRLVLVGKEDYFATRLREDAKSCGLDEQVVFFGHASDEQLAAMYSGARLYVFPSLNEGFGIPPLEAMSFNVPVASSNATCLPEVLGDAAAYFEPHDVKSMAATMDAVANDAVLRESLIAKGKTRVTLYSWRDCGAATLAGYKRALEHRHA